jgi:hypothetical protein
MSQERTIHIVSLEYDIMFNDSDYGRCYAGDGKRLVKVFDDIAPAKELLKRWNPVLELAAKEKIVYPRQANNSKLKKEFGFDLHDLDDAGDDFKFKIESFEVYSE